MSELPKRVMIKSDGRIVIPENMRNQLGLKEGSILELEVVHNKIIITVLVK